MIDLQELITRGRFIMADAPRRLMVFESVNGKRTSQDIAKLTKRHNTNIIHDLTKLSDAGLIQLVLKNNQPVKKNGLPVYEKIPLARTIPMRYFNTPSAISKSFKVDTINASIFSDKLTRQKSKILPIPSEQDILEIAKIGENQIYEFKGPKTEIKKITREIAAMLNTSQGGIVFYGIDDDGNIEGSDLSMQKFDQPIQNSIRNAISPTALVKIERVSVLGSLILVIIVPPWNKKDVYQYEGKFLIRKGTNVFGAKTEELVQLYHGNSII